MEQIPPCEADRFSVSQEILCTLWNTKVHYSVYNIPAGLEHSVALTGTYWLFT
jgi:hypothetical protein